MLGHLPYHVQTLIMIASLQLEWKDDETSIEFELRWKIVREMDPLSVGYKENSAVLG